MQRRRGRGGLGRRRPGLAVSSGDASAFGVPSLGGGESSGSDSSSDGGAAVAPGAVIAAAAAATAQRAARRAAVLGTDENLDVGYSDGSAHEEAGGGGDRRGAEPERKSRYIEKLVQQAAIRKDSSDAAMERRLAREREKEDKAYAGKERFVTAAYKETLERREAAERDDDGGEGGAGGSGAGFDAGGSSVHARLGGVARSEDVGRALLDAQAVAAAAASVAPVVDRKRRRWGAPVAGPTGGVKEEDVKAKPLRGLRQNDAEMIEKFRQRYFERRRKGLAETARIGALGVQE